MKLTENDIKDINAECPSEQGVFFQPNGIPVDVKEPVIYMRWVTGGMWGGSYGGQRSYPRAGDDKPKFRALDLVLRKLKPNISFLEYREIEELVHTNEELDRQYYGNSTEYKIEYIILSELEKKLETI